MKPLNRIPILCTASILYLFIIGRNLSTKQTLAAARTQAGESADRCRHGMPSGYNARDPFFGPCWRCTCLPVLTLGMQRPGDAVTSILPAGIRLGRESAPQVQALKGGLRAIRHQADGGHCPSLQWSCAQMEARKGRYIYPLPRESAITPLVAFPCYDVMLPLKRCTDSAPAPPGAPGLSWGYWDWKGNTVSDGHYEAPCSPQIFRSSLVAFPVRSWLIPIGGALCRFSALCGGVAG